MLKLVKFISVDKLNLSRLHKVGHIFMERLRLFLKTNKATKKFYDFFNRLLKNNRVLKPIYNYLLLNYSIKHINKKEISSLMKLHPPIGTLKNKRSRQLIVSLTSFPERMKEIHFCLYSLLNQTVQSDEVILWLTKEEFPAGEKEIPESVLQLKQYGLSIKWCNNLRSYNKLLPSLEQYPDDIIVTADDDIYYPENWLALLYDEYEKDKYNIICHRAHRITFSENGCIMPYQRWESEIRGGSNSFCNFLTGVGGVLYPPNALYEDYSKKYLIKKLAPLADDIWFWAMAVLNNKKIRVMKNNINILIVVNPEKELGLSGERKLSDHNVAAGKNDEQIKKVLSYYPEILKIIKSELILWKKK